MSEHTHDSPNTAFMQNNPNRIDVTPEGANLLTAFMVTHQQTLDSPEPGQHNRDGVSVLAGDGSVISVIMQRGEADTSFRVTTTSLSDLNEGQEPKVEIVPYGLQMRDGYMRVKTEIGNLKYDTYGKEAEVLPVEGEEQIPVVTIASLLEDRSQEDGQNNVATANAEAEKAEPSIPQPEQVSVGGIRRFLRGRK